MEVCFGRNIGQMVKQNSVYLAKQYFETGLFFKVRHFGLICAFPLYFVASPNTRIHINIGYFWF